MAKALAAARSGFRRFFSISAFTPPPAAAPPPKADPSPNLFVSGLSKRTTTEGLREAFSKFGEVVQAKVVTDRVSGYSKGFGFVKYATTEDANEGIKGMDGKFLDGWVIFAEYARPRQPPSQEHFSQPQSNYGSTPQSNYSSLPSHSPSYYTSDSSSNFSSQTSYQPSTQPPSSNSFHAPQERQPQSSYYGGSVPPSSYSYNAPQTTEPQSCNTGSAPPSYYYTDSAPPSSYSSQVSQPAPNYASSYSNHASQSSPPPPNNGMGTPFNCSSNSPPAPPSWYPSHQTTQPTNNTSGTPHYTQSYYGSAQSFDQFSRASQHTFNHQAQTSNPAPGYTSGAPTYSPPNAVISTGNASPKTPDTIEPSTSYPSELLPEYDSERAANY